MSRNNRKIKEVNFEDEFNMPFQFICDSETNKVRRYFLECKKTPLRSGAERHERLIIDLAYKSRYIHPSHICELLSIDIDRAWGIVGKLLKKGYLKIKFIPLFGVGFHINGHGNYLLKATEKAKRKHIFIKNPYYFDRKIVVSSTISNKLFHDLIALYILLKNKSEIKPAFFIPEYASGIAPIMAEKIPDIFVLTESGNHAWIENELTPKSKNELKRFTALHAKAIRDSAVSRVYVYLEKLSDVKRYQQSFINNYIENIDSDSYESISDMNNSEELDFFCKSMNYYVNQTHDVQNYALMMGEMPTTIKLHKKYFYNSHVPPKLEPIEIENNY